MEISEFNHLDLSHKSSILEFICDLVTQNHWDKLLGIIMLSKEKQHLWQAASNSITLLARSGFDFTGKNFAGVKIPRGNLSECDLSGTVFTGGDLRSVDLIGANIDRTDFSFCNMAYTAFRDRRQTFQLTAFSPDGQLAAVVSTDITLWRIDS